MKKQTIDNIIQVNKAFYDKVGAEFSKTRQNQWVGWGRVKKVLEKQAKSKGVIEVLDIGCGNGRFTEILKDIHLQYTGIDSDIYFLNEAKSRQLPNNYQFINRDGIQDIFVDLGHYDAILAFGITHHIPSFELRLKWFKKVTSMLNRGGIFIFTIWNFPIESNIHKTYDFIDQNDLEEGDYFLGWNNMPNTHRYFHKYLETEIQTILSNITTCKLHERFKSDGKTGDLNEYFVLKS